MEQITGTTVWKYEVPDGYVKVIFNNSVKDGNGKEQTADLEVRADNVYDRNGYTTKTPADYGIGDDPVIPTEPFTVYYDNYLSKWGTIVCKPRNEGEERGNVASQPLEPYEGSIYKITVAADCKELQFSDGGTVNLDWVTAVPDMVYCMSGSTGKKISQWTTPIQGDLYVYLHGDWASPKVYIYTGEGESATSYKPWPGEAMGYDGVSGYWKYKVPDGYKTNSRVIISSESGRYPADEEPVCSLKANR